jgi:hypothetical protein
MKYQRKRSGGKKVRIVKRVSDVKIMRDVEKAKDGREKDERRFGVQRKERGMKRRGSGGKGDEGVEMVAKRGEEGVGMWERKGV